VFHMNYTLTQLARVSPQRHGRTLWYERLRRIWKSYLRLAAALGAVFAGFILTVQYFVILPPFAWLAKRVERRESPGWTSICPQPNRSLQRQY
jgi:hypothetical protein